MTVVVTRNTSNRTRGFLASCMLEVAPTVYTAPRMSAGVRGRILAVLEEWFDHEAEDASVVVTWVDSTLPGGQVVWTLGVPASQVVDFDGVFLAHRPA